MTMWSTTLNVGTRVRHRGELHTVTAIDGSLVTLRSQLGRVWVTDVRQVLSDESTVVGADPGCEAATEALGHLVANLTDVERAELDERVAHLQEMLTGYRSGSADRAVAGEPRAEYRPERPISDRQDAKANELGIGVRTIQRWFARFVAEGPAGLIDGRHFRATDPLHGLDQRWVDTCRAVLEEHVDASRPTRKVVLARVAARLDQDHGEGIVAVPHKTRAYEALAELTRGTNAFRGATKQKRSIARRPQGAYGRLRPTRPGEYLLLDTTRLDVFAMEPLTLRWVSVELTIALDLYTRCIAGLRLSPVSTKAVDAAVVLYEAITPDSRSSTGTGIFPYHGVPTVVLVDADHVEAPGLPGVDPETIVIDHGRIYLSQHLLSVCARLGISVQPARPYTPTDKAAVERFFRTLSEGLLGALPGYKGPDVYSRGERVEDQAFYFIPELEQVIREWVATMYHLQPHEGLVDPAVPGLELSPADMFEHGVARAGRLRVPARRDLVYDFLPVAWRTVQHYGVELNGLVYNGDALGAYRNARSGYRGANPGKWPIRYDPDDITKVFFQDPDDGQWHTLMWEHAGQIAVPFSAESLAYARRLATQTDRFADDRRVLAELLERWDAGLTANPTERRMA
ncbi:MAG: Mu transposase C-terminal domain-containing protein, partial [Actinomycetota bacterium]|nr:Mu transposase C-terminal domain-containing protein [Actinomycetota bacterium]